MKKYTSRAVAILVAVLMALSLSGCTLLEGVEVAGIDMSIDVDEMIGFLLYGWDGIYEEKERAEYVAPDPTVRTHEIRENHKVTTVNNVVTENHKVTEVNNVVSTESTGTNTVVASTDY